jgi:hypothetical protein
MDGTCGTLGKATSAYKISLQKDEQQRPLGRYRHRWEDNIKKVIKEIGCEYVDWIQLAQNRDYWPVFVKMIMNPRVPLKAGNFLANWATISFHGVRFITHREVTIHRIWMSLPISNERMMRVWIQSELHLSKISVNLNYHHHHHRRCSPTLLYNVYQAHFPGVKQPEREAVHLPSGAEVKNAWSYTSIPPTRLHGMVLGQVQYTSSPRGT